VAPTLGSAISPPFIRSMAAKPRPIMPELLKVRPERVMDGLFFMLLAQFPRLPARSNQGDRTECPALPAAPPSVSIRRSAGGFLFREGDERMYLSAFRPRTWLLAVTILAAVTNACAQNVPGPPPNAPEQQSAAGLPAPPSLPPDYSALPPPPAPTNADLAKRVSDLEKELAAFAAAAEGAKNQMPSKPLVAPSGRIQFDVANFSQNPTSNTQFGNAQNAVGFRRARIALLGEYEQIDYIVEMDFANRGANSAVVANQANKDQSTAFKDVYIQLHDLPMIGNVRVGHFKECFGLEQLTSDNYTTFMERSVCDEGAFVPGRNDGIMAYNWTECQRATWAIGAFTNQTGYDQPPTFQLDHWGLDCTMRGTYLPWYDEPSGGRGLLHLGIDYTYRSAPDNIGTFVARPECNFAPSIVNMTISTDPSKTSTALTDVIDWQVVDGEAALEYGPLCFQTEVFGMTMNRLGGINNNFYGGYAYVSYFLTGENRPYNRKLGVFDRVVPYEDFFRVRTCDKCIETGHGAWELAYRCSYINMLDGLNVKGAGMATDHTFGVNWYLNPFTRIMFNYVRSFDTYNTAANTRVTGGNLDVLEGRFAIDF
jgi:phosphate-selective porin OprO/OprP